MDVRVGGRTPGAASLAGMVRLVRSGEARSRAELTAQTGLSRATVAQRLDSLLEAGLLHETDATLQSGGRPARELAFDESWGVALVADIGESHTRVAITDLRPTVLAELEEPVEIAAGPEAVLGWIAAGFRRLSAGLGAQAARPAGIGLSLPAPVDFDAGTVVGPSVMRGWDDFDIRGWMKAEFDLPVIADNDVNLMTVAEHRSAWAEVQHLLFVKVGTGIGSGIVGGGEIYRGAQGAAGDIGHIRLPGLGDALCRCGNIGCVEALGAGWAIARDLRARGVEATDARDVLRLARDGMPEAIHFVRSSGRILGEVIADTVSVLNPSVIVVGGTLAATDELLLAGIRELVYQRALPLATRHLTITTARLGDRAGVLGAAHLVVDAVLEPDSINARIGRADARVASA